MALTRLNRLNFLRVQQSKSVDLWLRHGDIHLRSSHTSIDNTASIHPSAKTEPFVVIGEGAKVGENCILGANSFIGKNVVLGNDCAIGKGVVLENCTIGDRVVIHSGAKIGQDGFGFVLSEDATVHAKKPQELFVQIGSDVEIGANTTIDRGSWRDTVIGDGCKLDNLVQIGHNVHMGEGCVIAAQSGIAGSTTLGKYVFIGGQVGIMQHRKIGDFVRIAAKSGVMTDLEPNQSYGGTPAVPARDFHRQTLFLRKAATSLNGKSQG